MICSDVIEHVQSPQRLLQEIYRLLSPEGVAIISTPIRLTEQPMDKMHVYEWFESEFQEMILDIFPKSQFHRSHPVFWMEMIQSSLKPFDGSISDEELKAFFAMVALDDDVEKLEIKNDDIEKIKAHYPVLQGALNRLIQESMQPYLEVAKGIKSTPFTQNTWENIRDMKPEEFSEQLQGRFSKELVLNNLQFDSNIPLEKQKWIQDWVQQTSDEKVKQFLFALTGSRAIGSTGLAIHNRGENIYFHTCFNSVDMPLNTIESKELLVSILESTISDPGRYTRS